MPSSTSSGKHIEMVNKVFLKFSIFYGHIWKSLYKNEHYSTFARKEWGHALERFDTHMVDEAIETCLKHHEMPPTLPQFMEHCKQLSNKHKAFYQPVITERANPCIAEMNLNKIKSILNMCHK